MPRHFHFQLLALFVVCALVQGARVTILDLEKRATKTAVLPVQLMARPNSERFAQGLTPLKPRQTWEATRARSLSTSPIPCTPVQGQIAVYEKTTSRLLGYISSNTYQFGSKKPTSWFFKYTPTSDGSGPVALERYTTGSGSWSQYMTVYAKLTQLSDTTLGSGSSSYLLIKATTFPYRIPFDGQESIVGVVDPLSAAVRVSWRNPSSQSFTPAIYVTGAGELFFTGNAGKTAKDINTNLSEVTLKFVPN